MFKKLLYYNLDLGGGDGASSTELNSGVPLFFIIFFTLHFIEEF